MAACCFTSARLGLLSRGPRQARCWLAPFQQSSFSLASSYSFCSNSSTQCRTNARPSVQLLRFQSVRVPLSRRAQSMSRFSNVLSSSSCIELAKEGVVANERWGMGKCASQCRALGDTRRARRKGQDQGTTATVAVRVSRLAECCACAIWGWRAGEAGESEAEVKREGKRGCA